MATVRHPISKQEITIKDEKLKEHLAMGWLEVKPASTETSAEVNTSTESDSDANTRRTLRR